MVMLVTLQQASDHLRRDTNADDNDLTLKIHAASNAILNYLGSSGVAYDYEIDSNGDIAYDSAGDPIYILDSAGDLVPLPEVQSAVLLMLGVLYADREGKDYIEGKVSPRLGDMSLPRAVHWLLDPLRRPVCQ